MPESRKAGMATMTPITAHTPAAARRERGFPWAPRCPTMVAPMPAKVIWHNDRRPAYPTMGTTESPTMASPHMRLRLNRSGVETVVAKKTAAMIVPTQNRPVPFHVGRKASSRLRSWRCPRRRDWGRTRRAMKRMIAGTAFSNPWM